MLSGESEFRLFKLPRQYSLRSLLCPEHYEEAKDEIKAAENGCRGTPDAKR